MVYDCILLNNEIDVLNIRLNELDKVVDKFIIAESTKTHTNKQKPLYFAKNRKLFRKFLYKIEHLVIEDSPDVSLPWIIERHQFSALAKGLRNCKPNDIILHGPVDEIPRADKVIQWKNKPGRLKTFLFKLYMFYLNFEEISMKDRTGTVMFKYKYLKDFKDIYYTRYLKADIEITNGGWHFSYMGGIHMVKQKLASFTHQELNKSKYNTSEAIMRAILSMKDPFDLGWKFKVSSIEELPDYVQKNKKKFNNLLYEEKRMQRSLLFLYDRYLFGRHFVRLTILRRFKSFAIKFLNAKI